MNGWNWKNKFKSKNNNKNENLIWLNKQIDRLPYFFDNGQHNFLRGEEKEGGRENPRPELHRVPSRHIHQTTVIKVVRRIKRYPEKRRLVLFKRHTLHLKGAGDTYLLIHPWHALTIFLITHTHTHTLNYP